MSGLLLLVSIALLDRGFGNPSHGRRRGDGGGDGVAVELGVRGMMWGAGAHRRNGEREGKNGVFVMSLSLSGWCLYCWRTPIAQALAMMVSGRRYLADVVRSGVDARRD